MPAITKRYDRTPDYGEYYHPQPLRRSAPVTQAPAAPRFKVHWFVYVGILLIAMLAGYIVLANIGAWWQGHQDDSTYGMPRTYQTDAVVGHNDSAQHPSHFTAENLHGLIFVTEFPGGDITKARTYIITSTAGNDPTVPAKVTFQDVNGDGKLDMVVVIGDTGSQVTITRYNDGSTFDGKP